ncbi:MAG: aldo/keto reductase [Spirochaetes bacterium RBG_16_49_21]|nr:MAG: aldo/keto reductase [Spirochaetes bacterium RBG_16_49_21]
MNIHDRMTRRRFLTTIGAVSAGLAFAQQIQAEKRVPIKRPIPRSGETLPVIGMGTSGTFEIGNDSAARRRLAEVLRIFFDNGGTLIDSSPMYGSAEEVVGDLLKSVGKRGSPFIATKVWTYGRQDGIEQMQRSMRLLGVKVIDLMQVHNLRDWRTHLKTLREWKKEGKVRYIGITTSHGRFHEELEQIMRSEPLDFVQFSYSLEDRRAEKVLLPLAADRGIGTLINRPFERGGLFGKVRSAKLPEWSKEFDCETWAQFFLKFVAAHPATTCVIPATAKERHMLDNMAAGFGRLPDADQRKRMIAYAAAL